jgi:hypothetical protein
MGQGEFMDNKFLPEPGRPLLPTVTSADLKAAWAVQQQIQQEMQELAKNYPPCPPGTAHQFDQNQIPLVRELVKFGPAIQYRLTMLAGLRGQGAALGFLGLNLPGLQDEKPSDAAFKAFAVVPMIDMSNLNPGDPPHEGWPFDMEELSRLLQKDLDVK